MQRSISYLSDSPFMCVKGFAKGTALVMGNNSA